MIFISTFCTCDFFFHSFLMHTHEHFCDLLYLSRIRGRGEYLFNIKRNFHLAVLVTYTCIYLILKDFSCYRIFPTCLLKGLTCRHNLNLKNFFYRFLIDLSPRVWLQARYREFFKETNLVFIVYRCVVMV